MMIKMMLVQLGLGKLNSAMANKSGYNDRHFPIDTSLFNSCASDFMSI